jgi:hypothetical protein
MIKFRGPKTFAAALAVAALALTGCGGTSTPKTVLVHPSAKPPLYHQTRYDIETGWEQETSDKRVGAYLESAWHDFASFSSKILIDSRTSAGAAPPLVAAELARVQANRLPGFRDRGIKRVKLGHYPAIRWSFFGAGKDWVEYFFEECGTSLVFRGSTSPIALEDFSRFYREIASGIKIRCDE